MHSSSIRRVKVGAAALAIGILAATAGTSTMVLAQPHEAPGDEGSPPPERITSADPIYGGGDRA